MSGEQLGLALEGAPKAERTAALRSYHVSNPHTTVHEALDADARGKTQEAQILRWMREHPGRYTPTAVWAAFTQWDLNSIRRSLTNLTNRGKLVRDKRDRRPGRYEGAKESTWTAQFDQEAQQ